MSALHSYGRVPQFMNNPSPHTKNSAGYQYYLRSYSLKFFDGQHLLGYQLYTNFFIPYPVCSW